MARCTGGSRERPRIFADPDNHGENLFFWAKLRNYGVSQLSHRRVSV
jgi:hypothetical protein